ncbi:TrkA family potassium uptake protein [uncultured Anaerococcus sp.]|uniref:potassium channel family protein n=1 Tax=uncultured Anaerococcus sp. TaxID=293428 RepID=UPI00288A358E|nr:TrkA family potassium uptake protein [uncultured Anaerococcus sp.]
MKNKNVLVLGLGRFGSALARKLFEKGVEVMAVDRDYTKVQRMADQVTYAAQADMTDEEAMKDLGIKNFDIAVIATGSNIEASIEATLLCKDAGITTVVAKATTATHERILEKIGADKIIFPELDSGERLARVIAGSNLLEFIEFSKEFSLAEVRVHKAWIGKNLMDLDFRNKYNLNVVAFERSGQTIINPGPHTEIEKNDLIVIIGKKDDVEKVSNEEN